MLSLFLILSLACNRNKNQVIVAAGVPSPSTTTKVLEPQQETSPVEALGTVDCPPPDKPPIEVAQPWLQLSEVDADLAQGRIRTMDRDLSRVWYWPIKDQRPIRLGSCRVADYGYPWTGLDRPGWSLRRDDESIAVFLKFNAWCLVHSKSEGWAWLLLRDEELPGGVQKARWSFYDEPWRDAHIRVRNPHPRTEPDGSTLYGPIDKIQPLEGEILRDQPNEKGKELGPVSGKFFKMTDIFEDWVRVQEAMQASYIESTPTRSGYLKVFWNPDRSGWIRWRVPGPVPGSYHIRFRGLESYGYEK